MASRPKPVTRTLDARPDTADFRDLMFVPTLVEVPSEIPLRSYQDRKIPILDQGQEGACTGFGLAAVIHYLQRTRTVHPDEEDVSPRMLYDNARRYDEWPGVDYEGSSARGAMKGWHKHGVCSAAHHVYRGTQDPELFAKRWEDAVRRPLGAYFRVNHRDIVAMHAALAEVRILYATATVHEGWNNVGADGTIAYEKKKLGGHAFAIVAFDENGFWIQNSWGPSWGKRGYAQISYEDWLENGSDVWVARLGAPIKLRGARATASGYAAASRGSRSYVFCDLRPHIISVGNEGRFRIDGTYGTDAADADDILVNDIPRLTSSWRRKRLVLYAHGGLVPEDSAIQRVADLRAPLLEAQVYPLSFIWKTDFWTTMQNILQDGMKRRRPEGPIDAIKDFMFDRLDDALEPIARTLSGKMQWDEMKENALAASLPPLDQKDATGGAAWYVARHVAQLVAQHGFEVHMVAHSAGSIFFAPLVQLLTEQHGVRIRSCTLWAPAITMKLFKQYYAPALASGAIERCSLFTLTDEAERDDHCANIYHKSLLYLVSHAFEERLRDPFRAFRATAHDGEPILGMQKWLERDRDVKRMLGRQIDWIQSPNEVALGSPDAARSRSHGGFDDDDATLKATLARILDTASTRSARMPTHRSAAGSRDRRQQLEQAARPT